MTEPRDFDDIDWRSATRLSDFLAGMPELALAERLVILDAAASLLEGHYAHLPLKRQSRGVDPVARLRALRAAQLADAGADPLGEADFHESLCGVFSALHDFHTLYLLPEAYAGCVAFLPFQVGLLADAALPGGSRVIVTAVLPGFGRPGLHPGAEIVLWNGVPIARVLRHLSDQSGGANPPAARSRAVAGLTERPMLRTPPPVEAWVEIGYRAAPGAPALHHARLEWRVGRLAPEPPHLAAAADRHTEMDPEGDALRRHRKHAYCADVLRAEHRGEVPSAGQPRDGHPFLREIPTAIGDLRAWEGEAAGRRFGLLRIRSFKVAEAPFLAEIARLLALLPPEGLVIDLRDNPGGLVAAGERMLQYLTDATIVPVRVQFLATEANLAMCRAQTPDNPDMHLDLSPWIASLEQALAQGRPWSDGYPMTDPAACNDTGRLYPGPCVLLTSARCYSAADIFIAGFHDNRIGRILGVDANTGAGGANMWTCQQVAQLCGENAADLPGKAGLRVAIRRVIRVSAGEGQVLEEAGIPPDAVHSVTLRDLLEDDPDLIAHAVGMLVGTE